ncbi:MAG TPA: Holliday junction branch migration protein RuvA [Candidatus Saccharibacteria bacterium]|nr:Holliday junction branch migration protein RuvA [Candidatus Saccharibacteria bacterium]
MIATLRGKITQKNNGIIIECGGVGYGVFVTLADFSALPINSDALLFIHEHIKEDAHNLFGFTKEDTKKLFEQLLGVKNVGPKVALAVLDTGTTEAVRLAIAAGDVKFLQSAKGVGKRAAEQIVVELRDKVGTPVGEGAENLVHRSGVNQNDEALQALVSLGYTEGDAQHALQGIDAELSVEERIKQALLGGR